MSSPVFAVENVSRCGSRDSTLWENVSRSADYAESYPAESHPAEYPADAAAP